MADGRRRRDAKQARRDAKRRQSRAQPPDTAEEVSLIGEVGQALDGGHPLKILNLVSTLILGTTAQPLQPSEEQPPTTGELVAALIDLQGAETTALLAVLGDMLIEDNGLRAQCRRAADERQDSLPDWLADLNRTTVHRAVRMTFGLGEGHELLVGARFTDGQEMTCVVYIDHSESPRVGDAFFVPDSIDAVLAVAQANNTDPDVSFAEVDVSNARAGLRQALDNPLSLLAVRDSDTWPACRALVQWLAQLMPAGGGNGYPVPMDSAKGDDA
ncbi:hypothetical protein [Mycolicibacterium litorale]|uniref:Uncharacterized protein n=1 Tax=Mycolicibacterium litorale TaxID=758802 RepID=A0AAD1IJY9_9MYCO|nr:hypothetical protein [Mycolicibacterium litorale]MCV7415892.1 hypothetical protein [Mycolicibacterium litorale]BBY17080.1 hypothetical protein MLIT_26720 [Mycolicibacterium litorale]